MPFDLEAVYAQYLASGLSLKAFHARYYAQFIEFEAFRHRIKRLKKKLEIPQLPDEQYDMPIIKERLRGIKDRHVKIAALSDIHFGDHDGHALELAYRCLEEFKPHIVLFGGDEFNLPGFSRHPIDPRHRLDEDPDNLRVIAPYHQMHVLAVEQAAPKSIKIFRLGNHDHWILRETIDLLPHAIGIVENAFVDMVRANGQVLYPGETDRIKLFGVNFQHMSKSGVNPAKNNMTEYDMQESVCAEHIHRFSMYTIHGRERQLVSVTNRCLCNLTPYYQGYIKRPTRWEHGVTFFEIDQTDLDLMPMVYPLLFRKDRKIMYTHFWGKEIRA